MASNISPRAAGLSVGHVTFTSGGGGRVLVLLELLLLLLTLS